MRSRSVRGACRILLRETRDVGVSVEQKGTQTTPESITHAPRNAVVSVRGKRRVSEEQQEEELKEFLRSITHTPRHALVSLHKTTPDIYICTPRNAVVSLPCHVLCRTETHRQRAGWCGHGDRQGSPTTMRLFTPW